MLIVSQMTARNLWPGEDAVGKLIEVGSERRSMQVIGVAEDVKSFHLGQIEPYYLYLPSRPTRLQTSTASCSRFEHREAWGSRCINRPAPFSFYMRTGRRAGRRA